MFHNFPNNSTIDCNSIGELLETEWNKIRNKYRLYYSQDRKTDVDDLMKFMDAHLKKKPKNKSNSREKTKTSSKDFADAFIPGGNSNIDDMIVDKRPNEKDEETAPISSAIKGDTRDSISPEINVLSTMEDYDIDLNASYPDSSYNKSTPPKETGNPKQPDPYSEAIKKAFKEIPPERQLDALIYLTSKVKSFKTSKM